MADHMKKIADLHHNNLQIFKDPSILVKALLIEGTIGLTSSDC